MKLFFDIGNTNIKLNFRLQDQDFYFNYDTKSQKGVDFFYTLLPQEIKNQSIKKIFICSVVPQVEEIVAGTIKKYWQKQPVFLKPPLKTGIRIKVNSPQTLGADLIALAAFVNHNTQKGIIVNAGTATTFVVVENGSLEGVIIAPGLMTSYKSLLSNSSKISDIDLIKDIDIKIGKTTSEAISIGLLKGHAKMVQGLVNDFDGDYKIFLSGGHARKIKNLLPKFKFIKEATIEGMKIIEQNNEK